MLAYSPDSLVPTEWQSGRGLPALSRALGYDLDSRMVWLLDSRRRLVGLDLESGQARTFLDGVERATVGPDGAAFVVDTSGRVLRLLRRATAVLPAAYPGSLPTALFGGQGGRVIAVQQADSSQARLLSDDHSGPALPLGDGPVAATYWGELLAVSDRNAVALVRSSDGQVIRRLGLSDPAIALAFSPSGHRLYALEGDRLQWFDRFGGDRLGTIRMPGPARQFRLDASGRWLLVQPAAADSAWVVDLATGQLAGTVPTGWRSDLPLIAGATTILAWSEEDVIGYSLATAPPKPSARLPGGGADLWLALPWTPSSRAGAAAEELQQAQAAQDAGLLGLEDVTEEIWLQVSSSQNPDWADDLARQLADEGFPTAVWRPRTPEDGFRVVVGPFPDRPTAEETGRKLDRPFFVVVPPRMQ